MTGLLPRVLRYTWWPIFPSFAIIVWAFTRDRACLDRYHLLPGIDTTPLLAWSIATIYVLGHVWLIAAYLATVLQSGALLPRPRAAAAALRSAWWQTAAMLVIFAIEYLPAQIWRWLAHASGLCG